MIKRFRPPALAGDASWMMAGYGFKLVVQAVYFVIVARGLGATGYGAFIGTVALAAVAAPFAAWGSGNLLVKHVARNPVSFSTHWARALVITAASGGLLLGLVVAVGTALLPAAVPWELLVAIAASDLLFARFTDIAGQAFQAFERLRGTALVQVMPAGAKLLAACILIGSGVEMTVTAWGWAYLAATASSAVVAVTWVHRTLGRPGSVNGAEGWELREGFFFAVGLSSQTITNDTDKTLLTRLASLQAAGIYGAAYRVIEIAVLPIRSVLAASYARFFRHGQRGLEGSISFARRLAPLGVAYGVVAAAGLWVAAPLLAVVLGDGFAEAGTALRWLSVLPLLKLLSSLPADALTGADLQGRRSAIQAAVAVGNIALNLWLIPAYGWRGAAVASVASDSILAASLWLVAWTALRHARARAVTDIHPIAAKDLSHA